MFDVSSHLFLSCLGYAIGILVFNKFELFPGKSLILMDSLFLCLHQYSRDFMGIPVLSSIFLQGMIKHQFLVVDVEVDPQEIGVPVGFTRK